MVERRQSRSKRWWIVAALVVANAVILALVVRGMGTTDGLTTVEPAGSADRVAPGAAGAGARGVSSLADETPPWRASAEGSAELPPGAVPASEVDPPPPDPSLPMPPPPVEPVNPALERAPMHNPGGVNRDRPDRGVPGLD